MSKFTKTFTKTFDFDGDTITATFNRMLRKDALEIMPYLGARDADGRVLTDIKDQVKMLDFAGDYPARYLVSMTGLTVDGMQVSKEEFVSKYYAESYFTPLVSLMLAALFEHSFISEDVQKKSVEQPAESSAG